MKKTFVLIFLNLLINNFLFFNHAILYSQAEKDDNPNINYFRDIYPDTWVASDGLGRKMPTMDITGPIKKDQKRFTGIFYITWHTEDNCKNHRRSLGSRTRPMCSFLAHRSM